jgi:mannosyltransferase
MRSVLENGAERVLRVAVQSRNTVNATGRAGRMTVWLLLGITLLAGALRLHHIGSASLWTDEAASAWIAAQHSASGIWSVVDALDARPPLYYWLLHVWLRLGTSEAALRLLSATLGLLTVPVIYGIGRTVGGRYVGLVAALLFATSAVNVHYSQEVRMYSLLTFAGALSLLGMTWLFKYRGGAGERARAVDRSPCFTERDPSATRRDVMTEAWAWLAYIAGTAIALWTHYPAVFLPLSANLALALTGHQMAPRPGFMRRWIVAQAAVIAVCLPLIPLYLHQVRGPNFPPIEPVSWPAILQSLAPDLIPLYRWRVLFLAAGLLELILLAAVAAFMVATWRRNRSWYVMALTMWLAPVAGETIASVTWRPVLSPKVLAWTVIPLYVIVAAIVASPRTRSVYRSAVFALMLSVAAVGAIVNYGLPDYEAWRPAAQYVADLARRGDLILFNDAYVELPFDYYFRRYHVSVVEHGVPADFGAHSTGEPIMTLADVPALQKLAAGHHRLWLVYSHFWYTDPLGLVPKILGRTYRVKSGRTFRIGEAIEIRLYQR